MNKYLTIKDILNCTNGELIIGKTDYICKTFEKDTRKIKKDDVYIGIKGENFDGSLFWKDALKNGAKVVVVQNIDFSKENLEKYNDKIIIKVADTIQALHKIANFKRKLYGKDFPLIAVTGSVGKTSTKDVIAEVLSQKYKVLKTQGNHNNDIGLPFTILSLKDEEVAVIEMGMNHLGEISRLSKIAEPTISVITNVGTSHIGNLGSRENILKAKLEILDGMENKFLIINNDNDLLHNWYEENKNKIDIKTFGIKNKSEAMAEAINIQSDCSDFVCKIGEDKFKIKMPIGGEHFILNGLCAAILGKILDLSNEEIQDGIEKVKPSKKRMEIIKIQNGITIINDSYNASYESMKASIEYLASINSARKIAILGDMFELGSYAKELHRKVGEEVAKNKIDILICCGENSKYMIDTAIEKGMPKDNIYYLNDLNEIEKKVKEILKENDIVLIKASNGMKFFELADKLIKKGGYNE